MENITINKLELASELADYMVKEEWDGTLDEIINEDDNGDVRYTEIGQDLFNHYYDVFETIIENCKSN
jgi:hypothetical protein